jgi:hypothetical protein
MARTGRVLLWILAGLVVLGGLVVVVALVSANTASGRRWIADRLEQAVTSQIPGRMEIGEVTGVEWLAVRATDVRFFHKDGREVLHVARAYVEADALEALQQRLTFRRVAADGGSILMTGDPDGRLSLEAAMDKPSPSNEPGDPKRGLHYDMRNMHVENFKVKSKIPGFGEIQMNNVTGVVHVWRLNTVGTRVRLQKMSGQLVQQIAGSKVAMDRMEAIITGAEAKVADVQARLLLDKTDKLTLRLQFAPKGSQKVKLQVLDKNGTQATTLTWLLHAAAGFSGDIHVEG